MASFLSAVGALVNALFVGGTGEGASPAWVTSVVSTITANPILMIGFIISVACLAVGVVRRLTKLG